jgi:uncharacterized protein YggE
LNRTQRQAKKERNKEMTMARTPAAPAFLVLLVLLLLGLAISQSPQAQAQAQAQEQSTTFQLPDASGGRPGAQQLFVEGEGKEWVNNDMVRIAASIKSDTDLEGNTGTPEKQVEDINALIQTLFDLGIPRENVTTYGFYNEHTYEYPPSGFGEPRGNTYISAEINIFLYTGENGGGLWPNLLSFSQDPAPVDGSAVHMVITSIEQFVSEEKQEGANQAALSKAVDSAKATAQQLSQLMEVTLGDILIISDNPIVSEGYEEDLSWVATHGSEAGEMPSSIADATAVNGNLNGVQRNSFSEPAAAHLPLGGGKFVQKKVFLVYAITSG